MVVFFGSIFTAFIAPIIFTGFMQLHGLGRAFLDTGFLLSGWGAGVLAFAAWCGLGKDLGMNEATLAVNEPNRQTAGS